MGGNGETVPSHGFGRYLYEEVRVSCTFGGARAALRHAAHRFTTLGVHTKSPVA